MWYGTQRAVTLERQLEKDKAGLLEDLERAEDLAGFYRRQVQLEATMMLVRISVVKSALGDQEDAVFNFVD